MVAMENWDLIIYTQMLHGAGIFTYIYPKNGPVL
jgi:hypothetical protein